MNTFQIKKIKNKPLIGRIVKDEKDVVTLVSLFFKNIIGQLPGWGIISGTTADYYQEKIAQKRQNEVNSCIKKINQRLEGLEIKQEAIDYLENSLLFRLEEIILKLGTNPGKGFDEILADYVVSALSNLTDSPEAKDLILSSLLSIDSIDVKVMKKIDFQFKHILNSGKKQGASFIDIVTLMKSEQIDSVLISRSIQRLQSQDLIHPLNNNNATIQELPAQQELLEGVKSPQYYSQGGFVISAFGRRFLRFLKLSK